MAKKKPIRECNICREIRKLSDDHVPPTCCQNKGTIRYYRMFEKNIASSQFSPKDKPRIHQNGIYFTSICEPCNNKLGRDYDTYLGEMVQKASNYLSEADCISGKIHLKCKPNRVVRSIAGHLLAAFNEYNSDGNVEVSLRNYYSDENADRIVGHYLYCWLHPYYKTTIIRNVGIAGKTELNDSIISVFSFYPFGFLLSEKRLDTAMTDLTALTTTNIDEEAVIAIDTMSCLDGNGQLKNENWPVYINDDYIYLVSPNIYSNSVVTVNQDK